MTLPLREKSFTHIAGYYTRNVEIDGKKYAVLEDFETKKQHLVPFKEEYGQLKMFRLMQYDGEALQYAPQKSPLKRPLVTERSNYLEKRDK